MRLRRALRFAFLVALVAVTPTVLGQGGGVNYEVTAVGNGLLRLHGGCVRVSADLYRFPPERP